MTTRAAALVHDLNYIVEVNSHPEAGKNLRTEILSAAGYSESEIDWIEKIITEAHTATRGAEISKEGMALSDSDTLFKALPTTPILFTGKYLEESKADISKLAHKVVSEQKPLFEQGIYFYTDIAKEKYMHWAKINLDLWNNVMESLDDPDVQEILSLAREAGVL